jgi:hypothetical protein
MLIEIAQCLLKRARFTVTMIILQINYLVSVMESNLLVLLFCPPEDVASDE